MKNLSPYLNPLLGLPNFISDENHAPLQTIIDFSEQAILPGEQQSAFTTQIQTVDESNKQKIFKNKGKTLTSSGARKRREQKSQRKQQEQQQKVFHLRPGSMMQSDSMVAALRTIHIQSDSRPHEETAILVDPRPCQGRHASRDIDSVTDLPELRELFDVARQGDIDWLNALLCQNPQPDWHCLDTNGDSPVMIAAANGHAGFIQTLINAGIDVNRPREDGWDAAKAAAVHGRGKVLKAMVNAGIKVNANAYHGLTIEKIIVEKYLPELTRDLIEAGCFDNVPGPDGISPEMLIAERGRATHLKHLLQSGIARNAPGPDGRRPSTIAAENGHANVIRTLLEYGDDEIVGSIIEDSCRNMGQNLSPTDSKIILRATQNIRTEIENIGLHPWFGILSRIANREDRGRLEALLQTPMPDWFDSIIREAIEDPPNRDAMLAILQGAASDQLRYLLRSSYLRHPHAGPALALAIGEHLHRKALSNSLRSWLTGCSPKEIGTALAAIAFYTEQEPASCASWYFSGSRHTGDTARFNVISNTLLETQARLQTNRQLAKSDSR